MRKRVALMKKEERDGRPDGQVERRALRRLKAPVVASCEVGRHDRAGHERLTDEGEKEDQEGLDAVEA
jgi:hypothetical protein